MKKRFLTAAVLFLACTGFAQVITPEVINSAGGTASAGGIDFDYSIGEPCVVTLNASPLMVTQGFLQPSRLGLVAVASSTDVSCADSNDGTISVNASVSGAPVGTTYTYQYFWSPAGICTQGTGCSMVTDLPPGTYSVEVIASHSGGPPAPSDTVDIKNIVIAGSTAPCLLEVFNGITPNGDGVNDFFYIKNIEVFPNNIVYIFNRWGLKLAEIHNYNNKDNYWNGAIRGGSSDIAPSGTYYYMIDLNNGAKPVKGWIELTHR